MWNKSIHHFKINIVNFEFELWYIQMKCVLLRYHLGNQKVKRSLTFLNNHNQKIEK